MSISQETIKQPEYIQRPEVKRINSDVSAYQEPIIDNNTIREFILYEEVKILQRSEFKQSIGNVKT
jgi:hypothetical protein